jgi:biopolymer transport protein TolR
MASVSPGTGRNRGNSKYRYTRMAEINVTPFVDVMLVLLIVFMVTAPLLTVGVPVDLPKTKASSITDTDEPLVISIDAKGDIWLQESLVPVGSLVPRLQAITGSNADIRIFVRGDASIAYGQVMEVMGEVSAAGFRKVSLLTRLPDAAQRKR